MIKDNDLRMIAPSLRHRPIGQWYTSLGEKLFPISHRKAEQIRWFIHHRARRVPKQRMGGIFFATIGINQAGEIPGPKNEQPFSFFKTCLEQPYRGSCIGDLAARTSFFTEVPFGPASTTLI